MTSTELNAAIAAGTMTITRLPAVAPRRRDLVMTRVGGSRSAVAGESPRAAHAVGTENYGKRGIKDQRRRFSRNASSRR